MIIRKLENIYIIKIPKESLGYFDFFNQFQIKKLFQKIIKKLSKKYKIKGTLEINAYSNNNYGIIMEIEQKNNYTKEIDIHIHFHLDSIFLIEIPIIDYNKYNEIYYYKNKFYTNYQKLIDSKITYKTEEIINKGIRVK